MAWVKLDDAFPEHPKVVQAGDKAAWLYVCGLTYASRHLTNGFIPFGQVGKLTSQPAPKRLAQRLVEVGLWEQLDNGYLVHDYTEHQRTKEQVQKQRKDAARRMAEWRAAHNGR